MTSNAAPENEFYIGYVPRAPESFARRVFRTIFGLNILALAIGLILVFGQQPFARSTFEYGQLRDFAGVVEANPYPTLLVSRPGAAGEQVAYSRYLLVAPGKHGADSEAQRFAGQRVGLRGSLIYRDGQTMIELTPGSLKPDGPAPVRQPESVLGEVKVSGEIVDSKCYLGVMNPGRTKVHRDCAVRCISGGIPPMLVTSDAMYLLVGSDGRKLNQELLHVVGETIEVHGIAIRSGEMLIIKAEPAGYQRTAQQR